MAPDHFLWFAKHFKGMIIKRTARYTVIKLDDQHELRNSADVVRNQLGRLDIPFVEAEAEIMLTRFAACLRGCRLELEVTIEEED